jgi:hypothetical protein
MAWQTLRVFKTLRVLCLERTSGIFIWRSLWYTYRRSLDSTIGPVAGGGKCRL